MGQRMFGSMTQLIRGSFVFMQRGGQRMLGSTTQKIRGSFVWYRKSSFPLLQHSAVNCMYLRKHTVNIECLARAPVRVRHSSGQLEPNNLNGHKTKLGFINALSWLSFQFLYNKKKVKSCNIY